MSRKLLGSPTTFVTFVLSRKWLDSLSNDNTNVTKVAGLPNNFRDICIVTKVAGQPKQRQYKCHESRWAAPTTFVTFVLSRKWLEILSNDNTNVTKVVGQPSDFRDTCILTTLPTQPKLRQYKCNERIYPSQQLL